MILLHNRAPGKPYIFEVPVAFPTFDETGTRTG